MENELISRKDDEGCPHIHYTRSTFFSFFQKRMHNAMHVPRQQQQQHNPHTQPDDPLAFDMQPRI